MMKDLINYGVYIQNSTKNTPEKTLVILGMARSGTSMAARVLEGLGVFIGHKKDQAVFEDVEIAQALENNKTEEFKRLVNLRNAQHALWGWKRPGSLHQIETILKYTRNPHFIIIYRDLLSVALRNKISMNADLHQSLKNALETYEKINQFVASTQAPVMLVSYEKAITKKRKFVKSLALFAGIKADPKLIAHCAKLIETDRSTYLENSNINKTVAKLEKTENGILLKAGKPALPNQTINTKVLLNQQPISSNTIEVSLKGTEVTFPKNLLVKGINVVSATFNNLESYQNSPLAFLHDQQNTNKKVFMFLHIPKTAGTSFRTHIEKMFPEDSFFPNRTDLKNNKGQYPAFQDILNLPVNRLNQLQFISGHYTKAATRLLPITYNFITFFRKPVDRIISNLIHFKAIDPRCKNMTLDEIFDDRQEKIINLQIKFILNSPAGLPDLLKLSDVKFHEHMKNLLQQLQFFGLQERLSESMLLFHHTFGLDVKIEKNPNPKKLNISPDEKLLSKINAACAKENLLYDAANHIFEAKLSKLTS